MKPRRPMLAVVAVIGLASLSACGTQQSEPARSEAESQTPVAAQSAPSAPTGQLNPTATAQPSGTAEPSVASQRSDGAAPHEPTPPADAEPTETKEALAAPTYRDRLVPGSLVKPVTELDAVLARGNKLVITSGIDPPRHAVEVHDAMFTADGRLIATLSQDGKLKLSDAATGRLRHEFSLPGHDRVRDGIALLAAASRKPLVALASRNEIVLYDAESGKQTRRIRQANELNYASIRLTPDGDRLLAMIHRKCFVWSLTDGDDRPLEFELPVALDRSLTLTPDGKSLLRGNAKSEVEFYDLATGKLRRAVKVAEKNIDCTAIDSTGTIFAVADTTERIIAVYDVATGAARGKLSGDCSNLSFHGSGLLLVGYENAQLVHLGTRVMRQVGIARTYRRGPCERMEISPDGTRLLVPGGNENRGLLYNIARTQEERTIAWSDAELVFEISTSHDGRRLALYDTKSLRLLSWPEGETLALLQLPKQPHGLRSVEFSPDDTELLLAVGEYRGDLCSINIYSTRDLELLHEAKAPDEGFDLACFTPDAKGLLIFGDDKTYLWNIAEKRMADGTVPFVGKPFCWVGDAAKKNLRLVTSHDKRLHVYSWPDRKELRSWDAGHQSYRLIPSSAGPLVLAYGDGKGKVRVWNIDEGKLVKELVVDERHAGPATFSGDGKHLITFSGTFEKTLKIWSCATWEVVAETSMGEEETAALTAARQGPEFFTSNYNNRDPGPRITRQWNIDSLIARLKPEPKATTAPPPAAKPEAMKPAEPDDAPPEVGIPVANLPYANKPVAFLGDGSQVFITDQRRSSSAIELATQRTVWEIETGEWSSIAVSADGSRLAAAYADKQRIEQGSPSQLRIWDTSTKQLLADVKTRTSNVGGMEFSPDGATLAVGEGTAGSNFGGTVAFWDVAAGKIRSQLPISRGLVTHLRYSRAGKLLAFFEDGQLSVWDLAAGELRHRHRLEPFEVRAIDFSADDKYIAICGGDEWVGGAALFDTTSGKRLPLLADAKHEFVALAFSPSGDLLVTAEVDAQGKTAFHFRSWPEGKVRRRLAPTSTHLYEGVIRFSPDGARFVESAFGSAHMWRIDHLFDRQLQRDLQQVKRKEVRVAYVGDLPKLTFKAAAAQNLEALPELTRPFALAITGTAGLTDAGLDRLLRFKNLARLELEGCTAITPSGLRKLIAMPLLTQLGLKNLKLTPEGVKNLAPLEQLELLDLTASEFGDELIPEILRFRRLKELNLAETHLTPEGLERLKAGLPKGCRVKSSED